MQKIKEHNIILKNESDKIVIRSIKNTDLIFYKNWFRDGHILKDAVEKVSEEEINKWISNDTKRQYIFIIEFNEKPYGEIVLWNDNTLIISGERYKKPFYNIMIKFYEKINDSDINYILDFFIKSIKQTKIKINSLYTLIDEKEEINYVENYLKNGFKNIEKELYKTKSEKYFKKNNIENQYEILTMLIKDV